MNARYYDPQIGQFISPDTLVPDATNVFDYNRYMYARGNPMKYTDPTGHYSDSALMTHFGCKNWACVEANFQKGGAYAGLWGWLAVLRNAEDGDSVAAQVFYGGNSAAIVTGKFITVQGKIMVDQPSVQIGAVKNGQITGAASQYNGMWPELTFAQMALIGAGASDAQTALYTGRQGTNSYDRPPYPDCNHHDCVAQLLDAGSTGAALIAADCTYVGAAPCASFAVTTSAVFGAVGTVWTAGKMLQGNASLADVAVAGSTTYLGYKLHPYFGPIISGYQWYLDNRSQ